MLSRCNRLLERVVRDALYCIFILMVALLFFQVVGRYILHYSPVWTVELAQFAFVWVAFLGIALATRQGEHILLELFAERAPARLKVALMILGRCLMILVAAIMVYSGLYLVGNFYRSTSAGMQISMAWFHAAVPVTGFLMFLFEIEALVRAGRN